MRSWSRSISKDKACAINLVQTLRNTAEEKIKDLFVADPHYEEQRCIPPVDYFVVALLDEGALHQQLHNRCQKLTMGLAGPYQFR